MLKRLSLVVLALVVFAPACGGGGGDVPADAVAVVEGTEISRAELEELIERTKKGYAAQKLEFPKVGTPEYQQLQTRHVALLVQLEEFEREADKLGIEVTEKEVDDQFEEFLQTRYEGDRKVAEKELQDQGVTMEALRDSFRVNILTQKLWDALTKDVKVEEAEILAYYQQNLQTQYQKPASREVRHILISEKKEGDEVDFPKSKAEADRIYAELVNGGDFAALAKEHSDDTTSAVSGGKLSAPITRGQTVPEFDKVAFELKEGVVSKPVKTTYGYHIIEALSPVTEAKTTPFAEARTTIRLTLLQEKKNAFMTDWVEDLTKKYEGKVSYATGFEPPDIPDATTTETDPS